MTQNLKGIEQTISDLIQFTKDDLDRLKLESDYSYHCNISAIYNNSMLKIENSRIIKALNRRNKYTERTKQKLFSEYDPMDALLEDLPKGINKADDYISCKVPNSLKGIVKRQLNVVEKKYDDYKKEKQKEIMDNFGKGPMAWAAGNITLPIAGIFHSLMYGEILYAPDEESVKEVRARELDESYRDSMRDLKTAFTDLMIAKYFRYVKEFARVQKDQDYQATDYVL